MSQPPSSQKQIALVLATYNRSGPLDTLLQGLAKQTLPRERWEVIVGVDGSVDNTIDVLESWKRRDAFDLRFFTQTNSGQSVARHKAIEMSSAERIIVVDDDMELSPGFLACHIMPGNIILIGKVVPEENWLQKPLYALCGEHSMLLLHQALERGDFTPSAAAFVTQNVSFPRQLYLDVGGFDSALRLDEDRELGVRFTKAGATFQFAKDAWAIHHSAVGKYETWEQRWPRYGRSSLQVWRKHGQDPALHPLRNFITGSSLNRMLVQIFSRSRASTQLGSQCLRRTGEFLQALGARKLAIYTHKAILAIQYHRGLAEEYGSWQALRAEAARFRADPRRPRFPTGKGSL